MLKLTISSGESLEIRQAYGMKRRCSIQLRAWINGGYVGLEDPHWEAANHPYFSRTFHFSIFFNHPFWGNPWNLETPVSWGLSVFKKHRHSEPSAFRSDSGSQAIEARPWHAGCVFNWWSLCRVCSTPVMFFVQSLHCKKDCILHEVIIYIYIILYIHIIYD